MSNIEVTFPDVSNLLICLKEYVLLQWRLKLNIWGYLRDPQRKLWYADSKMKIDILAVSWITRYSVSQDLILAIVL